MTDIDARLLAYLDAMLERNRAVNLTAIRDRALAEALHVRDALACAELLGEPQRALDIGSGNGFPGIAVAAMRPECRVTLMERTGKKARALEELAAAAGFTNIEVVNVDAGQAPTLHPELRRAFGVITARAVATPDEVARLAAPLARENARMLLWLEGSAHAAGDLRPGWERDAVIDYELPAPAERKRRLVRYRVGGQELTARRGEPRRGR